MLKHCLAFILASTVAQTAGAVQLLGDVEVSRIPTAEKVMAEVVNRYQALDEGLANQLSAQNNERDATQLAARQGHRLWQQAVRDVQSGHFDDRSLYWARLSMLNSLKNNSASFKMADWQQQILASAVEKASRGFSDIQYDDDVQIKIFLTGFDPFFLDKDISQSNPSGLVALALDGFRFDINGKKAQIETAMIPVRFADFDQGIIESLLSPIYRDPKTQFVFTVSMGRSDFDIERFPGRNRSAAAPDNQNLYTGASKTAPVAPKLNGKDFIGPEFVEFSLPVAVMQVKDGQWKVNDNHTVTTLGRGEFNASSLSELQNETSVEGSGGGYLSNEISYRAIVLQQKFNSRAKVGHIHTPRVKGYDNPTEQAIVEQVRTMVMQAAASL
ncbi:hypothetical protein N5C36_17840 [Shewanella xiamenensis]|nr:hypothetical protein [Shewanella xiamenensis]MDH1315943.1 hypothetical protein [Shewanella xiamenensis]